MFFRQRINKNNNLIQRTQKRNRKGRASRSNSSRMNQGKLDIQIIFGV